MMWKTLEDGLKTQRSRDQEGMEGGRSSSGDYGERGGGLLGWADSIRMMDARRRRDEGEDEGEDEGQQQGVYFYRVQ